MKLMQILAAGLLLLTSGLASAGSPLEFEDAWAPLAPPGRTMAGYVTIRNTGDETVTLTGGESVQFDRIEIHSVSMDDGVMRMRRVEELVIEPGDKAVLERGGLHLMMFEPQTRFQVGDRIDVELVDSDGQRHALMLEMRER